uniref:Nucleoporin NUP35 n=1 Tax=Romanomermis culicivorax TaxID=13658 RepID=A0A915KV10_ROMCU
MEPMVTGSPTFYDAVSNTPGVNATPSRSFLPGYLMGHHHRQDIRSPASNIALNASDNRSMMASTMSPSVRPPNLKVTWSPLLDSTNYYEPNNSVAYLQQEDSENYYKMTPRRLTAAGNFPPTPSESTCGPPTASFMESFSTKGVLNGSTLGVEQNTPGSRAAQSVAVNAVADDNSRIVTIFGFTAEFIPFILQHFSQCGTIVAHETANKCNWIHVKFESKLQASKALARNGRILNETLKIGVEQCKDENDKNLYYRQNRSHEAFT